MAIRQKKLDDPMPGQRSLFEYLQEAAQAPAATPKPVTGTMNVQMSLREALNQAIKGCDLSRWEIAGKMSDLIDCEISKAMLDAWTAESKEGHRFPAEFLPAFCKVTGDRESLTLLAGKADLCALPKPDILRVEIQKSEEAARKYKKQAAADRKLLQRLQEMEMEAKR